MPHTHCPICNATILEDSTNCPGCGTRLSRSDAPIRHAGGKLKAAGTVVLAVGVIATVIGAWWGPALLFPGVVVFFLGRFL